MTKKILVVQFRLKDQAHAEQQPLERVLRDEECELIFRNALSEGVDWDNPAHVLSGFDAVILSGSGELYFDGGYAETHEGRVMASRVAEDSKPFARYLIDHDIPTLGICFGHHLLGHAAGSDVGHSHVESKTGTHEVHLTEEGRRDPLMRGIPERFMAQYGHKDVLFDLPQGAVILAQGEDACRHSAIKYNTRVYSVQFHPELCRDEVLSLIEKYPEYVPKGVDAKDLFSESTEAERILKNFVALAV